MALTATSVYLAPDIAAIVSEAFERAGIAPRAIGNDHIESALRSLGLMMSSEWLPYGIRTYQYALENFTTQVQVPQITLPATVLAVSSAVLRRSGRDTPINAMSRTEYLELPDKLQTGRPDRYLVDRQWNQAVMTLWRNPENNTDQIFYWALSAPATPGLDLTTQVQNRPELQEAMHAGLAARLAQKFNPARFEDLQVMYRGNDPNPHNVGGALALALDANRDWGDITLRINRRRGT